MSEYIICYADGGPNRVAYIINGVRKIESDIPTETSNESEWYGFMRLLENLDGYEHYLIYLDSMIVVNQFNGEYNVHAENLRVYYDKCKNIVRNRGLNITVKWISRKHNQAGWLLEK